ncbi:MAG: hypothetical protein J6Y16_00355 [Treponema sp.]|nr:hypothetical protein [Treponema sp.]
MKPFTRKQNIIFLSLSIFFVILSILPILFSNNLLTVILSFLEQNIFHRSFDIGKKANTLKALIAFPIFFMIFLDSDLFIKFSTKSKITLLCFYALIFIVFSGIVTYWTAYKYVDSDLVSELLLGKECYLNKTFWPKSWYYSTEFRTINTQLITAPLFLFTSNLHLIKTISTVLLILFLPLSLFFLLNELRIQDLWIKFLGCLWIICPASKLIWDFVHFGNYYIPHICIAFCFLGLFYGLIYNNYSKKRKTVYLCLFYFLSFISGISGIRYILYFEFPLAVLYIWKQTTVFVEQKKQFTIKSFFFENDKIKISFISLIISGIGYLANSLLLSKIYSFEDFTTRTFKIFGDIGAVRVLGDILSIFGYQNNVSVFTPGGIINILIYIFIVFFLICLVKSLKNETNEKFKEFHSFVVIMIVFNTFSIVSTQYFDRYLILPFIFVIPCIILFIKNKSINIIHRTILTLSFTLITLTSSFLVYENSLCGNANQDKENISNFLKENDYHYGYASFWNANVLTYLTDGKVELAHFSTPEEMGSYSFNLNRWLAPERYFTDDFGNNEKIVFIVSKEEFNLEPAARIFANGKQIFDDGNYYIFEYKDNKTFKESF